MSKDKVIEAARKLVSLSRNQPVWDVQYTQLCNAIDRLDKPHLITMEGEYTYRNGMDARVLCVDRPHLKPVISIQPNGGINTHYKGGNYNENGEDEYDLIPLKKKARDWYIVFTGGDPELFNGATANVFYGHTENPKAIKVQVLEDE